MKKKEGKNTGWVSGIPIEPSQEAMDHIAIMHKTAEIIKMFLMPPGAGGPEQVVLPPGMMEEDEFEMQGLDRQTLESMDPLRRAAVLGSMGLVYKSEETEPDPTAENLRQYMEADGLATKPGPGGVIAGEGEE